MSGSGAGGGTEGVNGESSPSVEGESSSGSGRKLSARTTPRGSRPSIGSGGAALAAGLGAGAVRTGAGGFALGGGAFVTGLATCAFAGGATGGGAIGGSATGGGALTGGGAGAITAVSASSAKGSRNGSGEERREASTNVCDTSCPATTVGSSSPMANSSLGEWAGISTGGGAKASSSAWPAMRAKRVARPCKRTTSGSVGPSALAFSNTLRARSGSPRFIKTSPSHRKGVISSGANRAACKKARWA